MIIIMAILLLGHFVWLSVFLNIYKNQGKEKLNTQIEEYVWIGTRIKDPMFVEHDQKALRSFAEDYNVRIRIEGPEEYDIPGQIVSILKEIDNRPAGIMVLGMERSLSQAVNKVIEAGIPVITVDADLPDSKRIAHIGSDWHNIGIKQAEAMVKLIGGSGQVAMLGIGGADNMEQGFEGFRSVMKDYPKITVIGPYDDMSNREEASRITEEIIKEYPNIAGIAGFDSNSGPGIGKAIKEAGKKGEIIVTCVDIEQDHVELLREGVLHHLVGQKRELFTYYGATLLYDYHHGVLEKTSNYFENGEYTIPYNIDTGLIEVDIKNVDYIMGDKFGR